MWTVTLAVLAAGYFALAGYDYGTGVLLRLIGRDQDQRRHVLGAGGPFFLGNQVWLVAFAGVLLGIFPKLEARLFAGAYPVVLATVLGVVVFTVAVQLRGRLALGRKEFWDMLITVGAVVTSVGWGVVLGAVLQGLPLGDNGYPTGDFSGLLTPVSLLFGVAMFALFTVHGAAFLAMRAPEVLARRASRVGRMLVLPCVVAIVAAVGSVFLSVQVAQPGWALAGAFAVILLVLAAGWTMGSRTAFVCMAFACGLPVLVVGIAHSPDILVSSLDGGRDLAFAEASSSAETLSQVGWLALPVVPVVIAFQVMTWWAFRNDRARLFW
ncbi:cytochrome d ubiquinol oxidase subunit II [Actinocrispum sp. NPDC049592]|uniref:cytochrome d ubiquinol oxidase subunit II n=1 Tax=Actinocrispum sp. NPDC049592 TaxID=3154835 RepID=UPI00342754CC